MEENFEKKTKKGGNGKPRIVERGLSVEETKKRQEKRKTKKETNDKINELKEVVGDIIQTFLDSPTQFFEKKEQEVASLIEKYGNNQVEDLENGCLTKKDYALEISQYVCKPIIPYCGKTISHNADTLEVANDFYWEKIVMPLNEKMHYIPMIADLLRILGISISTFNNYSINGSEDVRESCQKIYDRFITYYQRNGMQKNISEIMAMFVLKTTYKQRETETPQIQINNVVSSASDTVKKYAQQHGYEIFED